MRKTLLAAALCLMPTLCPAAANIQKLNGMMQSLFNDMKYDGNVTSPKAWKGQSAGYLTGGSVFARTSVRNVQLVSLQLPQIRSGCGGIDAYLGAFSFINGDEVQRLVKQIMSNAAGYAFDLALQTAIPEMKSAKDFLQKLSADLNSSNMSSCQAAEGIVGGLWPTTQVSQRKICQDIAGDQNMFADWAASRQGCTIAGDSDKVLAKAKGAQKDQVLRSTNLIWQVLSNNSLMFANDPAIKEYVMGLTGTVIFDEKGGATVVPPLTHNDDTFKTLLDGGSSLGYSCDNNTDCLKVSVITKALSESNSLRKSVAKSIQTVLDKAASDTKLTTQEQNFINSTNVKILTYAIDSQSLGLMEVQLIQLTDYIALDILIKYLRDMLDQTSTGLAVKNFPEEQRQEMRNYIKDAQRKVNTLQSTLEYRQNAVERLDQTASYIMQQLSTGFISQYYENYNFGVR